MNRHAVHMQADVNKAWQSARRWRHQKGIVLQIAAQRMEQDGHVFGLSENEVWCTKRVDVCYICGILEN